MSKIIYLALLAIVTTGLMAASSGGKQRPAPGPRTDTTEATDEKTTGNADAKDVATAEPVKAAQ